MSQIDLFGNSIATLPVKFSVDRNIVPGSDTAREMTRASGINVLNKTGNLDHATLLEKGCLHSHIWNSRNVLLSWKKKVTTHGNMVLQLLVSKSINETDGPAPLTTVIGDSGWSFNTPLWPTPNASDNRWGKLSPQSIQRRIQMGKSVELSMVVSPDSGSLNPDWVEWLMGFPMGWTNLSGDI
jgi:DNA (cytosine-5)-methyltransferase 1